MGHRSSWPERRDRRTGRRRTSPAPATASHDDLPRPVRSSRPRRASTFALGGFGEIAHGAQCEEADRHRCPDQQKQPGGKNREGIEAEVPPLRTASQGHQDASKPESQDHADNAKLVRSISVRSMTGAYFVLRATAPSRGPSVPHRGPQTAPQLSISRRTNGRLRVPVDIAKRPGAGLLQKVAICRTFSSGATSGPGAIIDVPDVPPSLSRIEHSRRTERSLVRVQPGAHLGRVF
jgi:hypothetical protein